MNRLSLGLLLFVTGCAKSPTVQVSMCITESGGLASCRCESDARRVGSHPGLLGEKQIPKMIPRNRWFAVRTAEGDIDQDSIRLVCEGAEIPVRSQRKEGANPELLLLVPPPSNHEPNSQLCSLQFSLRTYGHRARTETIFSPVNLVHRVKVEKQVDQPGQIRWRPPLPGLGVEQHWLEPAPPPPPPNPCSRMPEQLR